MNQDKLKEAMSESLNCLENAIDAFDGLDLDYELEQIVWKIQEQYEELLRIYER